MTEQREWSEFVEAHGQVIGYDMGGPFIPVLPGNQRAIRIHEETAALFGRDPGVRVYAPVAED